MTDNQEIYISMKIQSKSHIIALFCLAVGLFAHGSDHLVQSVFRSDLREQCGQFVDNVLRQIPSATLWAYIDKQVQKNPSLMDTDAKLYNQCLKDINHLTPTLSIVQKMNALRFQKNSIGNQIKKLIGENKTIQGMLEIGGPGTYTSAIRSFTTIQGPVYAMDVSTGATDRLKAFSPDKPLNGFLPYDTFIPLANYNPISENDIANNSLDLVLCTIGLHHITPEKLDAFVASIARTLRPGGHFILRDHNSINDDVLHLTHAAHTLFNLLMINCTLKEEQAEYRNFQPIEYWIELLAKHGLRLSKKPQLLQQGDPTLNTMLLFTKVAQTPEERIAQISRKLKADDEYVRDAIQTNLTTLEWFDVDASQDYGDFINHTPFYKYPWFSTAKTYASLFAKSWRAAAKKKGHFSVLTSPYTPMNTFIATSKIIECTAKGIVSYPMCKLLTGQESGTLKMLVNDPDNLFTTLDPKIRVVKKFKNSDLSLIKVPRYKKFLNIMLKTKDLPRDFKIIEIAGQKEIQLKACKADDNEIALDFDGCSSLYDWKMPSQKNKTYYALNVEVEKLPEVIRHLSENNVHVLYVHDF